MNLQGITSWICLSLVSLPAKNQTAGTVGIEAFSSCKIIAYLFPLGDGGDQNYS